MHKKVWVRALLVCLGALLMGGMMATVAGARSASFYQTAPTGWKAKPVGTLLKYQRIQKSWPALATLKGYRVMYVSRGALGDKVFETAAVYFPTKGRAPAGGRRVMAWDHGTCGVGDSAAPSRYPWLYPEPVSAPWDWYAQWVGKLGRMGYIVTCPDYEGLGTPGPHPYLHAASEGRATIDAVRAARQLAAKLGVRVSARWGVAGHSQGGQAALAAAELAGTYGKGLSLMASVAVAPAVEIATVNGMSAVDPIGWPYVGYTAWGIRALYPDFDFATFCGPWLMGIIDQAPDLYYDDWWGACLGPHWVGEYPAGSPGVPTLADTTAAGWESDADVIEYLKQTEVGTAKAAGAVLVLQGTDDVFMATFDTLVGKLQAQGDDLQYVILQGQRHDYVLQAGWPYAKAFLEDRLPAR